MAQQVFLKKDEKIKEVAATLNEDFTDNEFIERFKELYPKEWGKVVSRYQQHERDTKSGKTHPMPEPNKYLSNVLKVWKVKQNKVNR